MRSSLVLAALALLAAGCEKTTKPGPEPQNAPSTSTSVASPSSVTPKTEPDPPLAPMPPDSVTRPLAKASNTFAFDLWQKMSAKSSGNATFSPASISIALAMTYGGAKGATATQMEKTMHFAEPASVPTGWGALSRGMTSPNRPLKLRIANRLFGEKTYAFNQDFVSKTNASFGAAMELVDFKKSSEPVRNEINSWVE